jgi:hypothetical protein
MVLQVLLWILLGGSCFLTGHSVLVAVRLDNHFHGGCDRFLISVWLGITVVAPLLLTISIFTALSPIVAFTVFGGAVGLPLCHKANTRAVMAWLREVTAHAAVGTVFVVLGVALYSSQLITWHDAGLYHLQTIKWLAEYGAVPGTALIHERLGFSSSWLALAAPLDHGSLHGHVYSFLGGFAFCTMALAIGSSLAIMAAKKAEIEDIFLAIAFLLAIPYILFLRMFVSSSPDVPIIVLTILIAWTYIKAAGTRRADGLVDIDLLPLLLALGAVTIKLSALPLVIVTGYFYCLNGSIRLQRLIMAGCIAAAFLVPYLVVNTIASGYPLFPSPLLQFNLPWTLDVGFVKTDIEIVIQEWARWSGPTPAWGNDWNWILPWVKEHNIYSAGIIVTLGVYATFLLEKSRLLKSSRSQHFAGLQQYGPAITLAVAGLAFSLYKAPDLRFGLGYVVVMPALLAAIYLDRRQTTRWPMVLGKFVNLTAFGLATILLLSLHVYYLQLPHYVKLTAAILDGEVQTEDSPYVNLMWTPSVPIFYYKGIGLKGVIYTVEGLDYVEDDVNGLSYYRPEYEDDEDAVQCWDAPLPCAPKILRNVKLLDPARGLAAGFSRAGIENKYLLPLRKIYIR